MKDFFNTLIMAAFISGAHVLADAAEITGNWKAEFDTVIGFSKYIYQLKVDGDKLTGKAVRDIDGQITQTDLSEGKVSGSDVSFVEVVEAQDREIRIEYKGKIAGDEIKFTRVVGEFSTIEMVAKREKPAAPDLAGRWKSEFDTPVGLLKYVYLFKVDGGKLTGKAIRDREGAITEIEIEDGTVKGNQISFTEPLQIQDQEIAIEYSGKVSGDEIKFTRRVGDFGTMDIIAKRATAADAEK